MQLVNPAHGEIPINRLFKLTLPLIYHYGQINIHLLSILILFYFDRHLHTEFDICQEFDIRKRLKPLSTTTY
jgi:hypothetical protein